ncbi:MAG: hypothetical protein ACR2ML_11020 [Solirubrobacteraceae bacterium]
MTLVHAVLGVATLVLTVAAAAWGSWRWWQVEPSPLFWRLLRAAQVALVVEAATGGGLLLLGERPERGLHYVYGLVPLGVSFLAEQLRIGSAETVLEARGLESADAVRALPADQQRSVVRQIVRREMGVMALAAVVMVGLELRAAF